MCYYIRYDYYKYQNFYEPCFENQYCLKCARYCCCYCLLLLLLLLLSFYVFFILLVLLWFLLLFLILLLLVLLINTLHYYILVSTVVVTEYYRFLCLFIFLQMVWEAFGFRIPCPCRDLGFRDSGFGVSALALEVLVALSTRKPGNSPKSGV